MSSMTIENVFSLIEKIKTDMTSEGLCFVQEGQFYSLKEVKELDPSVSYVTPDSFGPQMTSHNLKAYFTRKGRQFHPKQRYSQFYTQQQPTITLTYTWSMTFGKLRQYLNTENLRQHVQTHWQNVSGNESSTISFAGDMKRIRYYMFGGYFWGMDNPESLPYDTSKVTIWIDIFFNDQNRPEEDMQIELNRATVNYIYATFHVALYADKVLNRAWCLFELAARASARKSTTFLRIHAESSLPQLAPSNNYFQDMDAFKESDKIAIRNQILRTYGNENTFNALISTMAHESAKPPPSPLTIFLYSLGTMIIFWIGLPFLPFVLCCHCCAHALVGDSYYDTQV